ncbi:MAG TPA: hypothetical protein VEY09_07160 [Pyrinomonadaceae bacterium]|nr:hypothetical protein [Pyrinomonadaceae bacterium]
MTYLIRCRLFLAVLVAISTSTLFGAASIGNGQGTPPKPPPGKWTLSSGVYTGPQKDSIPVDVYSVLMEADRGFTVTEVGLYNRDLRDVAAVKLRWYLTETQKPNRVLLQGDTQLLGVLIPAGGRQTLSYPVASFAKIATPLLKGGSLSGNYRLEVSVSEVQYSDETAWRAGDGWVNYRKVSYTPLQGRANQGCTYNATPDVQS